MTHPRFAPDAAVASRRSAANDARTRLRRALKVSTGVIALGLGFPVFAQAAPGVLAAEPVVVLENPAVLRRNELRRALIGGADIPLAKPERHRLSPEQRDALNRELREAMREVYERRQAEPR